MKIIREHTDQYHILTRIMQFDVGRYLVQAIDDDCGERIETTICTTMEQAERCFNRYVYGTREAATAA